MTAIQHQLLTGVGVPKPFFSGANCPGSDVPWPVCGLSVCRSLRKTGTDLGVHGMSFEVLSFAVPFRFGSFEPGTLCMSFQPQGTVPPLLRLYALQVLVEEPDDGLPQIALRGLQVEAMGRPLDNHELVLDADLLELVGEALGS
jgi:hypothetical protein